VVWLCDFPTLGQTGAKIALPSTESKTPSPRQEFHCHTGYPLAQCLRDILQLKKVLSPYPIEGLGHWTWVLVRSRDWTRVSRMLGLNPDSPAFTEMELRETFLEEALFVHDPQRTSELMDVWRMAMPNLLELAVTHELGHALCDEPNEAEADHFGDELRKGRLAPCRVSKEAKRKKSQPRTSQTKTGALRTP
jgi:hypothetical protein